MELGRRKWDDELFWMARASSELRPELGGQAIWRGLFSLWDHVDPAHNEIFLQHQRLPSHPITSPTSTSQFKKVSAFSFQGRSKQRFFEREEIYGPGEGKWQAGSNQREKKNQDETGRQKAFGANLINTAWLTTTLQATTVRRKS